jgi:hypothetical protein
MTIYSPHKLSPLIDGRQSNRAMRVRKGAQLLLHEMRHATIPELTLESGRRADLISLTEKGEIWIIEIKSSIEDFRVDRKRVDYRLHCDRLSLPPTRTCHLRYFRMTAASSSPTATALILSAKRRSIGCRRQFAGKLP